MTVLQSLMAVILFLMLTSCVLTSPQYRLKDGRILLADDGTGLFIPKDARLKDSLILNAAYTSDSVHFTSIYFYHKLLTEITFSIDPNESDSLLIEVKSMRDNLPIPFLLICFYDQQGRRIAEYSFFGKTMLKVALPIQASTFQLDYLSSKSDFIPIDRLSNQVMIKFDCLTQQERTRYTEVDTVLQRKGKG